jgi:hypothetical protein
MPKEERNTTTTLDSLSFAAFSSGVWLCAADGRDWPNGKKCLGRRPSRGVQWPPEGPIAIPVAYQNTTAEHLSILIIF